MLMSTLASDGRNAEIFLSREAATCGVALGEAFTL